VTPLRGSELREHLGRIVRETWVACAGEQDDPNPSHLVGWDELDEWNKEVDRRIGDAIAREVARLAGICERCSAEALPVAQAKLAAIGAEFGGGS
jgi:hypothetical protein